MCAALLHDVIEDTRVPAGRLRSEFGPEIAVMVEELTDAAFRDHEPMNREIVLVAIADCLHNLRTIHPVPAAGLAGRHRLPRAVGPPGGRSADRG